MKIDTEFPHFPREESDIPICLCGEVVKTSLRRFGGWKKIFEATLQESNPNALSEPLVCRWFNLHYVQKMIATGQRMVVFGKPRLRGKRICMDHPEFEVIEADEEISIHFRRITPIYPATEGLSQRVLRSMIYRLLNELPDADADWRHGRQANLVKGERFEAIRAIHFPDTWEARDAAHEHLVLNEFFAMQMLIVSRRADASIRQGEQHCGAGALLDRFLKSLPFELTAAQSKVIGEIRHDLATTHPMNRLLQGDVGSGKTVVAIAGMLLAAEARLSSRVHGAHANPGGTTLRCSAALARAAQTCAWRCGPPLDRRKAGHCHFSRAQGIRRARKHEIIIGTHALLYESGFICKLGPRCD